MTTTPEEIVGALEGYGVFPGGGVYRNLGPGRLYEETVRQGAGRISRYGALATRTGAYTGRAPNDRFIVQDDESSGTVDWGAVNRPISSSGYGRLRDLVASYLSKRGQLFVRDAWAGADARYGVGVRVVTESPWHDLFARNMFRDIPAELAANFEPHYRILHAPYLEADPEEHEVRSGAFVILNLGAREVLIGGTQYAGEIKKSVFSILNYRLTQHGVLPMHCAANVGRQGDTALFFGLSGTGKTTLSADPDRRLVGDDEHGWSEDGVFNFEGGCYAKTIRLSPKGEPEIYRATRRFGTILENVEIDPESGEVDYDSGRITENTRASYPIDYIDGAIDSGCAPPPRNVLFLTADAFGVLPPLSRLDRRQAVYHFVSGYTAKVAGTERGVTEPSATFSAGFGAPFLPRPPGVYASMLGEKIDAGAVQVWLVNTGWIGGRYGVGSRIALKHTRRLVGAALSGELKDVPTRPDPVFGVHVPVSVDGVPARILTPRPLWDDGAAYDEQAGRLRRMFRDNLASLKGRVADGTGLGGPPEA